MNCFLDKDQELIFGQEKIVESCLKLLVELATQDDREFLEELKFKEPTLSPITTSEVEELQNLCSQGKAMGVDGFVDVWIRMAEKKELLQDLWNERLIKGMGNTFNVELILLTNSTKSGQISLNKTSLD